MSTSTASNNNTVIEIEFPTSFIQNTSQNTSTSSSPNSSSITYLPRLIEMTKKFLHNRFFITIAYLKIIASLYGILFTSTTCNQPLRVWLLLMIAYDTMYICSRVFKPDSESQANNSDSDRQAKPSQMNEVDSNQAPLSSGMNNTVEGSNIGTNEESDRLVQNGKAKEERIKLTCKNVMLELANRVIPWFYFFLFFFGNCLVFSPSSDCSIEANSLRNLVALFLAFQYISIIMPVLVCFSILCLCAWMVGNAIFNAFNNLRVQAKNKNLVNTLKVMKYSTVCLEGEDECSICMCHYEQGDEVIELECSKMHHFHASCIKKWLKVDGICPMCRTSLQEMKKKNIQRDIHSKDV